MSGADKMGADTTGADWIGRTRRATDTLSPRLIEAHRATFGDLLADLPVPPGLHWALAPDMVPPEQLGRDAHPRLGLVLPDLGLPRRMWAGGEITFHAPFQPGDAVTRTSTITDVSHKCGRSGALAFVQVTHDYTARGQICLTERQDIVYREDPTGPAPVPDPAPDWPEATARQVMPDAVMLFRYSAITFNGHRIHYDHPYATGVEGYAGLVVHGPMQALWMMNLVTRMLGALPARLAYRGLRPLIADQTVTVEGRETTEGCELRVRRADGVATMQARAVRA